MFQKRNTLLGMEIKMKIGKTVILYQCGEKEKVSLYEMNAELRLFEFQNQGEILDCIREETANVIIINLKNDLAGKGTDGTCLARRIRQIHGCEVVPVIFLTAVEQAAAIRESSGITFCAYLKGTLESNENKKLLSLLLSTGEAEKRKIKISNKSRYFHFYQEDFVYAECIARTLIIHTSRGDIAFPYYPLKEFLRKMNIHCVYQCHRSIAVNRHYILGVDLANERILLEEPYGTLEIGRTYKRAFWEKFLKES